MPDTQQFAEFDRIDRLADELLPLLEQVVGDDEFLRQAAATVSSWAALSQRDIHGVFGSAVLCRRGLVEGQADALDRLRHRAEQLEQSAAALRMLIAHVA